MTKGLEADRRELIEKQRFPPCNAGGASSGTVLVFPTEVNGLPICSSASPPDPASGSPDLSCSLRP